MPAASARGMRHWEPTLVDKSRQVLTTGQVARICKVAPRTVSKWFDTGQLRGYRIPGSKDRRIPLAQLIRFMKAHNMPLDSLETGQTRLLVVDRDADLTGLLKDTLSKTGEYEVRVAESAFEAGVAVEAFDPHVILADVDIPGIDGLTLGRFFSARAELRSTQLIAAGASLTDSDRQTLLQQGFHAVLAKPFSIREVTAAVEQLMAVRAL